MKTDERVKVTSALYKHLLASCPNRSDVLEVLVDLMAIFYSTMDDTVELATFLALIGNGVGTVSGQIKDVRERNAEEVGFEIGCILSDISDMVHAKHKADESG